MLWTFGNSRLRAPAQRARYLGINQENEDRIFAAYQQTRHIS